MSLPRPRAIVYIDGFNLYYGALKGGPHRWLDLERFCLRLRTDEDVVCIRYFTSIVDGPKGARQRVLLEALRTRPRIAITLGQFKRKTVECQVPRCTWPGPRTYEVPTEKRTDVGIGVQMLDDAYQGACERFILISGDSDLVPAVQLVRRRFPLAKVITYRPVGRVPLKARRADELAQASGDGRLLPATLLPHCHLPDQVIAVDGTVLTKPAGW